ncbi:MAG: NUDIX hydrolase [Patescibacteria group bacterium]|nr:NUDIX hydrolase [Patescibacteria group bacterium]
MKSRTIGQGNHLKLIEIDWTDDEGNPRKWEAVERMTGNGIVSVMAVTAQKEVIFISQYRPSVRREVIEFPAGLCDQKGEALEETALRELREETGYQAKKIVKLFAGPVSAGLSSEFLTVFWATDLKFVGKKDGREEKGITVYRIPFEEADEWLRSMEEEGSMLIDVKIWTHISYIKDILA